MLSFDILYNYTYCGYMSADMGNKIIVITVAAC